MVLKSEELHSYIVHKLYFVTVLSLSDEAEELLQLFHVHHGIHVHNYDDKSGSYHKEAKGNHTDNGKHQAEVRIFFETAGRFPQEIASCKEKDRGKTAYNQVGAQTDKEHGGIG